MESVARNPTENDLKILLTILACLIVGAGGAVAFMYSGIYDVSALQPDAPLVSWALHTTSDHSVDARLAGINVPDGLDRPQAIQSGGHLFAQNCAVCHGGPGLKPTDIAQGLKPPPPNLFRANRKPWSEEMYRFIKYGVKMTAMPGFGKTLSDQQIWELVAFLHTAPGMSPQDFAARTGINGSAPAEAKPQG